MLGELIKVDFVSKTGISFSCVSESSRFKVGVTDGSGVTVSLPRVTVEGLRCVEYSSTVAC